MVEEEKDEEEEKAVLVVEGRLVTAGVECRCTCVLHTHTITGLI